MPYKTDIRRVRTTKSGIIQSGPVIYFMSRDQRIEDNWAIIYAQELALEIHQPLIVVCLPFADYPGLSLRQAQFALTGIRQLEKPLAKLGIPLQLITKSPETEFPRLLKKISPACLVFDSSPLKAAQKWKKRVIEQMKCPVYEIDAHNIVPYWEVSSKQEYAARTIRPKIHRVLSEFLTEFPALIRHPHTWNHDRPVIDWTKIEKSLELHENVAPRLNIKPGGAATHRQVQDFFARRLHNYNEKRNDPNEEVQSGLSPYLHFGQISAQRVALDAQRHDGEIKAQETFLEELIIRRELADNFCYYCDNYDRFEGFPAWAQETLNQHRNDPRPYVYSRDQLEAAQTHDPLWNAAQNEMIVSGKMHGYLRMYWAKKILEWSFSPEEALDAAIYLNDKYELDGYDPNGYTGIAWSIGGVHDRPWFEREIFGKVRYMSYNGCKRKFDIESYVNRISRMSMEARS